MAKFCIKPGLKEVEELATNLNLPYSIVSAKIVTWAEQNNEYSRFPSLEELNIKPQYQKLTVKEKVKTIEQVTKEQNNSLFGLNTQNQEQLEFHVNTLNVVSKFLENVGVEERLVSEFLSQDGSIVDGALAAANFIEGTVDIIDDLNKGRAKAWNKLPEEAAHWWYRLLNENSPLKKALWESHQTALKNDELYKTQYGKLVKSPSDLTEESIGQLIAEAIKRIETKEGNAADYSFFKKLLEWINSIIDIFKNTTQDPFEVAAMKILSSDMSDLMTWEEYRKLNNIVNFADVVTEQSVAPVDYTIISDLGKVVTNYFEPQGLDEKDTFKWVANLKEGVQKNSPEFNTQQELDNWVSANIKEHDIRQRQLAIEVRDNQIFFDRLLNKTFRKKSKFLPKTLRKYFDIIDAQNLNPLSKWNISQELQQITKKLTPEEKRQIVETNGYTNIAPTLKVLPDLLQKYRKNPIVLSEPIKIDGAKKQELSILNGIKEMIKLENPNLKSITAEEFVAEAHNWLQTNYLLGFANEKSYLSYRTDQTFQYLSDRQSNEDVDITNLTEEEIQRLPLSERQRIANIVGLTKQNPDVYHNKVSLRFNDMYHLKSGHFQKSPSAWGNLTYFYTGKNKWKDAVLLHEIQNDNIEFLREYKSEKVDLETSLGRYLQQLNADLLDNITQIESGGKKIIKNDVWSTNPPKQHLQLNYQLEQLKNLPLEQGLSQLKQNLNERIELYKSDNSVRTNVEKAQEVVDNAYSQRRIFQNFKKRGGIKSLLTKQELEDLKNILHQLNTEEVETATWSADDNAYFPDLDVRDLKQKKKDFKFKTIELQARITRELQKMYGDNAPLINLTAPAKPLPKSQRNMRTVGYGENQRRIGGASQELNENVNFLIAFSEKQISTQLSKNIEATKKNYISARNATVANNFNIALSKITLEQYATLIENYKYNEDLLNRLIDEQAQKDIQKETKEYNFIEKIKDEIIEGNYDGEWVLPLNENRFQTLPKELRLNFRNESKEALINDVKEVYEKWKKDNNITSDKEARIFKQKSDFETLKQQALDKKAELEKNYGKVEEEVKQTLEIEMNYFTPLIHHLIQKHINQYGKDFPMYFSGYQITKLTQGNDRTAWIYAGKDEINIVDRKEFIFQGNTYYNEKFARTEKYRNEVKDNPLHRYDILKNDEPISEQEYEKAYQQATERRAKEIKVQAAQELGLFPTASVEKLSDEKLNEGIKALNEFKKIPKSDPRSKYNYKSNTDVVIEKLLELNNNKPIETGAIYNAMSQVSGIKLIWQDKIEGLRGNAGGYLVDLTNYNYNTPILYGLDTSKVVPINPNLVDNSERQYSKLPMFSIISDKNRSLSMIDSILSKLGIFDTYFRNNEESNNKLKEILTSQGLTNDEIEYIFNLEKVAERKGNNISYLLTQEYSKYTSGDIVIQRLNKLKNLKFDKSLEDKLIEFGKSLGIEYEVVDNLKGKFGVDALGVADILNKMIYLAKERKLDTFPEEIAHFYVECLGHKEGLGKNLFDKIEYWSGYQEVYDNYSSVYLYKNGTPDLVKIKKEAIGQAIAEAIIKNYVSNSEAYPEEERDFWKTIVDAIKEFINKFRAKSYIPLETLTNDIAEKILSNDISQIQNRIAEVSKKNQELKTYDKTLENYPLATQVINDIISMGGVLTGSLALRKQGTIFRNSSETVHDLDFSLDYHVWNGDYLNFLTAFKNLYPNYYALSNEPYFGNGGEYVFNGVITDDPELFKRFKAEKGNFNDRLDKFTLEEQSQMLLIDFFFNPEGNTTKNIKGLQSADIVFNAKSAMGMRDKDVFDLINYKPYEQPNELSEYNYLQLPKFSLEDNNETLPQEELQDFINSLEVDKQYRFNYRVGEEVHEKYISLEEFDNTSFTGKNLATGISETFDYNNLTQNSTEVTNKLTVDEYVAVMKNILLSQEKIFSSRVSNEGDRVLHTKIVNSLKILEDYTDYADIEKFFDVVSENITQVGKLIKEINKYTDSNLAQLKRIGLLKDFIDSYQTTLNEILIPIKELSEGEALDNKVSLLIADIKRAEQYYFEIARPKVAKWLMEHLSPAMNEELERLGFKSLTAKDLEKELKNPTSDLSWVDTFLVAASNVNDKVTGLFSLALKKADQTARTLNVKLKNLLHPLHEELLKRSKEEIKATYQRMFTEETVTLGEEQIKVWKWIKEDNSDEFYNQKKALQAKINAAKELAQNNPSNEELSKKYKQAIKDLRTFLSTNGTAYTQTQMNELMEELRTSNWHRFDNYLKWYYEPIPPEEATVNDIRIGEGFSTQEFRYRDNFYKPKQELYSNKAYFDKFKEEDPLGYKLYKALHDSYMEAENKRPEDKRLNGVIPLDLMNEPNHLKEKKHLVKLDGDIYKEIPVRFSPYRNVDLTDLNITKGVINYVSQVNLQQSYSKILGAVDATVNTVKDSKPKNKDGSNIGTNRRLDKITDMVAQQIYREFNKDTGTWGKLLDNINQLVSWSTIGFSPISSSVNIVVGNIANYIEAMGGRRYTLKEHGEALAEFGKLLPDYISKGSESKLGRILERFDAIQGEFNKNLLNDFEYLRDDRKIKRKIRTSLSNVYFMQNAGEFEIQGTSTLALMKAAGVWELFDDEGNLKSGEETFEGEEAFVNKLHAMNKNNHGVYNSFDRLPWQTSAVFRLALAFRKWIVPTFRSRYYGIFDKRGEGARLDFEAGTVEQGYYTSFRDFVYDNYKSFMDNGTLILNFDNLSEVEKEGVKRTLQDMLVVATALALVLLLRAAVDDEGDDESLATWILINTFNRVASDYITYLPLLGIDDQLRTASTPFVAYRKIREMGDIIGDLTIGFLPDKDGVELFKTYKRNIGLHKKGDSKFVAKIEKIIPYYNIIEFLNPKTQFENFEKTRK